MSLYCNLLRIPISITPRRKLRDKVYLVGNPNETTGYSWILHPWISMQHKHLSEGATDSLFMMSGSIWLLLSKGLVETKRRHWEKRVNWSRFWISAIMITYTKYIIFKITNIIYNSIKHVFFYSYMKIDVLTRMVL